MSIPYVVDPAVCHGKAYIADTQVMVSVVLDNLPDGLSADEIVQSYPSLTLDDEYAAPADAADRSREHLVALP